MKLHEAIKQLSKHADELRKDFAVAHIDIFGSVARDEAGSNSDIDILVEYQEQARVSLFDFSRLQRYLEALLGIKVDLATPQALKKQLKDQILREKIRAA